MAEMIVTLQSCLPFALPVSYCGHRHELVIPKRRCDISCHRDGVTVTAVKCVILVVSERNSDNGSKKT